MLSLILGPWARPFPPGPSHRPGFQGEDRVAQFWLSSPSLPQLRPRPCAGSPPLYHPLAISPERGPPLPKGLLPAPTEKSQLILFSCHLIKVQLPLISFQALHGLPTLQLQPCPVCPPPHPFCLAKSPNSQGLCLLFDFHVNVLFFKLEMSCLPLLESYMCKISLKCHFFHPSWISGPHSGPNAEQHLHLSHHRPCPISLSLLQVSSLSHGPHVSKFLAWLPFKLLLSLSRHLFCYFLPQFQARLLGAGSVCRLNNC